MNNSATMNIFKDFHDGFDLEAGPDAPTFSEVWETYTSVLGLVGVNLMSKETGYQTSAANEIRMHLERHQKINILSNDMPLLVPSSVLRALQVWGKYYEANLDLSEYLEFIKLTPSILERFSVYVQNNLRQLSGPIISAMKLVAKSASIMQTCVESELEAFLIGGR